MTDAVFLGSTITPFLNQLLDTELPPLVVGLIAALLGGLIGGIVLGLFVGLFSGFFGGWTDHIITRARPNEGTRRSLYHAVISFVGCSLGCGLVVGLPLSLFWGPAIGVSAGLSWGLLGGLVLGLRNGGFAYVKHYLLRVLLWRNGYVPLNYIRFLNYAAERVFLHKVGGGYIFTHRLLMDYLTTCR